METEAAFNSSANSFILEKVLQEVKEVENRERVEDEEEAADEDLKFRPGFVHILKDRFALLSIKSTSIDPTDDDGPIKSSASVYDLSDSRALGNSRYLSKSSEQLDGRVSNSRHRRSLQSNNSGSPEKHSHRLNGSVIPTPTVSSRAYVKLHSKDLNDSPNDNPTRGHPSSIHLYSRSTDSRTLDRIRSAGNKVIIIESAAKSQSETKKKQTPPPSTSDHVDNSGSNENRPDEAWPVPNIVSATRSLFEQDRVKGRAPPTPTSPSPQVDTGCKSPKSPSSPSRSNDTSMPTTPPTQILVHGQPIKVLQTNSLKSHSTEKSTKQPLPAPRRASTPSDVDNRSALRKNSTGSSPKSLFLPASRVEKSGGKHNEANNDSTNDKTDTVVSVLEAKRMFDKGGSAPMDTKESKMSPKKSRALVFPASNSQQRPTTKKSFAPPPPVLKSQSNSAGPSSPQKTLYKTASLPSVIPKPVNASNPSSEVPGRSAASSVGRSTVVKNDPNTWQTWDDIPKPKRKSFVNEARRVDISKEQLSASRAKNKSFFFSVAEPSKKSQKLDDDIPNDRTIMISVPKANDSDHLSLANTTKAPSESRLAQQTFWDSYRNEDVKSSSNVDSELFGDFLKLMESAKAGSTDSASIERELDELPSTNIDDILNEASYTANNKSGSTGIRVIRRNKNRTKHKLSFANDSCLTSTYEYPSERAMIEELGISPDFDLDGGGELSIDNPAALFGLDDLNENDDDTLKTAKLLTGKPAVTSGSLASYTSKYGGTDYAWGQESESTSGSIARELLDNGELDKVDSKPAEDESKVEEEMTWSSAATTDLLF